MKTIKELLDTYRQGDHLEDDELELLGEHMGKIASYTADFGDIFLTATVYAIQVSNNCRDYLHSRHVRRILEVKRKAAATSANQ